jgi:hypothetical protein
MTYEDIRLECLRLAQSAANGNSRCASEHEIVGRAAAYYDFVTGKGVNNLAVADIIAKTQGGLCDPLTTDRHSA